jgi:hypothetical protein
VWRYVNKSVEKADKWHKSRKKKNVNNTKWAHEDMINHIGMNCIMKWSYSRFCFHCRLSILVLYHGPPGVVCYCHFFISNATQIWIFFIARNFRSRCVCLLLAFDPEKSLVKILKLPAKTRRKMRNWSSQKTRTSWI